MSALENTYTTTLKYSQGDIQNQPKGYDEFEIVNCRIHWKLTVEAREWGIKSIACIMQRIELTVKKIVYTDTHLDDDESEEEFVIIPGDWTINTEYEVGMIPDQIHPVHIEFDWEAKKIEVLIG